MNPSSSAFYNALIKRPSERSDEDVSTIFNHLRRLDVFERLHDAPLRSVCRTARLERHPANYVLFRKGQLATCWYILLSGSVFMNKQVYLPIGCFGKRSNMNLRRMSDCIVISPSDMIVIDYPDVQRITVQLNSTSGSSMASSGGQTSTSSTAFPVVHPNLVPSFSSSSGMAGSVDNLIPAGPRKQNGFVNQKPLNDVSRLSTSHQPQRFPTHSTMNSNQQHLQSPQKQFVFHRFPQTGPPAPSSSTLNPASHPWQNNIVNHVGHAQMPIASASISHRVPSPAPTNCTSHPIRASPTKSLHHYQQNQPARHHGTIAQKQHQPQCTSYQHAKCNSLSETSATNAMPANNQKQQNSTMNFTNGPYSHEIEVPFVRANHSAQQLQQRTAFGRMNQQQPLQQLSKQTVPEEQLQQEHFSPPRPPRTTHFVRAMTAGNSVVQQKKCLFEPTTSTTAIQIGHAEKDLEEEGEHTGTMKRREEPVNNGGNSSTLTRQNAKEKPLEISHDTEPLESMAMPPPASNFQRLSKIRLNMNGGRKSQQQQQQPPHCQQQHQPNGNSALSTTGMNGGQQLQLANVRIRQQSPQHRQTAPNGYQQQQANKLANQIRQSTASSTSAMTGEESDCFAGLPETAVDSEGPEGDEEDDDEEEDEEGSCPSHDSFQELRDSVRECLEKEPSQRGAEDLAVLIEFMASLPALASLPMGIKRQLCEKMVFAVVPHKGTTIMQHGERIDAWSVVVNGAVEHVHSNGQRAEYRVGDCFGVQSVAQAQYNDGEIRTLADDCEFVLVEHGDFYSIMSTLSRHVERENDNTGEVVREVERRMVDNQVELVITKASPDRLLRQLLVDDELLASAGDVAQMDSHFVEDFLLMHRVFFPDSGLIVRQLIDWFRAEPKHRDRVARIMLIWMNNHFEDFEANDVNGKMTALLNEFEELLGEAKMYNHQSLLSITCSVKSQPRQITLTRSNRAEPLQFQLIDGSSGGIYVLSADPDSSAQKMGLKRADEILEVNGQDFRKFSLAKAEELMRESTHLSITLKTNWIGFKEALQQDQVDSGPVFRPSANPTAQSSAGTSAMPSRYQKKSSAPMIGGSIGYQQQRERRSTLSAALNQSELHPQHYQQQHIKAGSATPTGSMSGAVSSKKVLNKLLHMIRGSSGSGHLHLPASIDEAAIHHQHQQQQQNQQMVESSDEVLPLTVGLGGTLRASRSNPDISAHSLAAGALGSYSSNASSSCSSSHRHSSLCTNSGNNAGLIQADQVLKVYRSDQSFRYIPVCADTNAKQLVHLALQEFGIPIESGGKDCCWWALYECSVSAEGVIRQKRLPDNASNLAEKIGLNARLYLRDLQKGESTLLPDELIPEVLKQARLTLYTLNAQCIATQLTLQDFTVFASIEPTEYVNHLFQLADDDNPCASNRHRGWSRLAEFEALFNREMWWVATEVCCERNIYRRSKLVKKFIKIARHCHMLRNLNSMFAIVSGLEKPAVRRLAHTWERVPGKYLKMLTDLQQLMDPSRNMSRYRQHLAQLAQEPPLLPIYPILRKDLTFAHEANPTFCGPRLVNFEKLRMIAQIVRSIQHFSSVHYDPMELVIGSGIGGMSELAEPGTIRKGGHGMMAGMASRFGGSSGSGGGLSRKKLYERTLMLRRVRAYLQAMPIIDSEVELDRLSLECEPATLSAAPSSSVQQLHVQGASSSSTARRRLPSPSPSSMSSQSSQSVQHPGQHRLPKFGVESPQAVQKMLSLVQNSKIKARNPLQHPSIGRSQLHHSFGGISVSAELPPIASDQRKRGSVTSNSTNAEENGNQNNTSSNNNNQNQPNNIATERAI